MNRKFFVFMLALGLIPFSTFAGVKVANVDLQLKGSNGHLNISIDGRTSELPDIKVSGKTIEISLDKAEAFNAITKTVHGTQLYANVVNGKAVIKAVLPYDVKSEAVELGWKNNGLEIIFPRGKVVKTPAAVAAATTAPAATPVVIEKKTEASKVSKEHLNEDYLNKLMHENVTVKADDKKDEVNLQQAAPLKTEEASTPVSSIKATSDNFSFAGYAAKFTIFLAMVLGLFYGVVHLLKKGVFNRGKLSFLNNTQLIEVLSTTYVAPKRTLLVVRAHQQVFLVANSESGLTFLSEMKDTTGLFKEGERQVTGTNFDLNLAAAETQDSDDFKIKENIMSSTPLKEEKGLAKLAAAKDDIVKFSDELKKKAKKLKPIEFN